MLEIEKPKIECVEVNEDGTYGKFVVEPLERGYGITLGNALRRILTFFITRSCCYISKNWWCSSWIFNSYQVLKKMLLN